jgi:undecaprenyl-diphosphatase
MLQAIVLGAVQGLTEFVPVSSSAHLVLVPYLLRWPIPSLAFDVAIHLGTLLALLVYFGGDLVRMVAGAARGLTGRGDDEDRLHGRMALLLAVGTIPAGVAGILLRDYFEEQFRSPTVSAVTLVGTAALIIVAEALFRRRSLRERSRREGSARERSPRERSPREGRGIEEVGWWDAIVMGVFQAVAITPGVSRSGATISAGLVRGLARDAAARFSFLLSIPAILGAAVVAVPDVPPGTDWGPTVAATGVAAVTGFATIAFLLRYLRTRTMLPFAAYCVVFAVGALAVVAAR